jgi:hypothetical protein
VQIAAQAAGLASPTPTDVSVTTQRP